MTRSSGLAVEASGLVIGWILTACTVLTAVFAPLSARLLRNG